MKKLLAIALVFAFSFLNAQNSKDNIGYINQPNKMNRVGVWLKSEIPDAKIEGSPYLFSTWFNTSRIYFDDVTYNIDQLNYNVTENSFVAKISSDSILKLNKDKFTKVVINNKTFKPYKDSESKKKLFFEELGEYKGFSFLKKNYTAIKKGTFNPLTQNYASPDKITIKEKYYVAKDGKLELMKLKRSDVLDLVKPKLRKNVIAFANKNELSFTKENDVVRILRFYNSNRE